MLRLRPELPRRAPRTLPGRPGPDGAGPPAPPAPGLSRVGLHLLLAALPLLAISAHVFGLAPMRISAAVLVIPLATTVAVLSLFAPHPADRIVAHGLVWGVLACAVYDVFRLDTVYLLGLWGDFIPTMGTWITGAPDDLAGGAVVGYLWRYVGDGGGIGMTFFVVASALGLHRLSRARVVLAAVAFAVFPVWTGLVGTVALAPRGQELMFGLTPVTVLLSLIGHLIFGLVLGLGFWHSRRVQEHWPWPVPALPAAVTGVRRTARPVAPPPEPAAPPVQAPPVPREVFVPRQRATPPSPPPSTAHTLDPDTWEQWRRRLETTQPGRRAHGGPAAMEPIGRGTS